MKILQINSVCGMKSTGKICTDLADVLALQGDDSRILYGRESGLQPCRSRAVRIATNFQNYTHAAAARLLDCAGFCSTAATDRAIAEIRQYRPDVVHLHNLHGYYLNIERLFAFLKKSGLPVVWTLHDCWPFTGHCAQFAAVGCDKWQTGCGHCPQKRGYPASLLADRSAQNYRRKQAAFCGLKNLTLVTPSHWLADLTRQSFLAEYPVRVIPNGIDCRTFCPQGERAAVAGISARQKIVLGVASAWSARKGLYDFIALSRRLPQDFRIVLVGLTNRQMRLLPPEITALSPTDSRENLAKLYRAAAVLLNPTHEDTFPTVHLEALACGTPVLTYRVGGACEMLTPDCGLSVECGDIDGLLKLLPQAAALSGEACAVQGRRYDKNTALAAYRTLYGEVVK